MDPVAKSKMILSKMLTVICGGLARISSIVDSGGDFEVIKNYVSSGKIVMPVSRESVEKLIAGDTVVIFSKTYCPYCKMAKEIFDQIKQQYTAIELDDREDAPEMQDVLGEMTGAKTVPRVFVKGKCIGGGTDVKRLHQSGELVKLLA